MPTSYTRQTSVFLTLWLSGLPCVLYPAFGDATAVVAMGMSFAILGLEALSGFGLGLGLGSGLQLVKLKSYASGGGYG